MDVEWMKNGMQNGCRMECKVDCRMECRMECKVDCRMDVEITFRVMAKKIRTSCFSPSGLIILGNVLFRNSGTLVTIRNFQYCTNPDSPQFSSSDPS